MSVEDVQVADFIFPRIRTNVPPEYGLCSLYVMRRHTPDKTTAVLIEDTYVLHSTDLENGYTRKTFSLRDKLTPEELARPAPDASAQLGWCVMANGKILTKDQVGMIVPEQPFLLKFVYKRAKTEEE